MAAGQFSGNDVVRINLWSAPRCASTSLMYSFAQRSDTKVSDEPLYAHYLCNVEPTAYRPYREEVLAAQNNDGNAVVRELMLGPCEKRVLFMKNMAKFWCNLEEPFLAATKNVILTRHPLQVLASWSSTLGEDNTKIEDTGLKEQLDLLEAIQAAGGDPIVIANDDLVSRPEGTLRALCRRLGIEFDKKMLKWKRGGIPEDGLWATYWYHVTHASTGFDSGLRSAAAKEKASLPEKVVLEAAKGEAMYAKVVACRLLPEAVLPNERNRDIKVHVGGRVVHRDEAKVSVFDSSVQCGDAVWEGLRVEDGGVLELEEHLTRLQESAHALMFQGVPSSEEVKEALWETLKANGMRDQVHVRLTLTRGAKVTSGMSPTNNQSGCCLIVLAEWKSLADSSGLPVSPLTPQRLVTSAIRRNTPSCLDSKIHHNNLLNNILAKIQANMAGADEALMLDLNGFVSETNAANFFIVKKGVVITPHADACLPGITRGNVLELAAELGVPTEEKNVSLTEVYAADEAFTTGTMGGLVPVSEVDGRKIRNAVGEVTRRLQERYKAATKARAVPVPPF